MNCVVPKILPLGGKQAGMMLEGTVENVGLTLEGENILAGENHQNSKEIDLIEPKDSYYGKWEIVVET